MGGGDGEDDTKMMVSTAFRVLYCTVLYSSTVRGLHDGGKLIIWEKPCP